MLKTIYYCCIILIALDWAAEAERVRVVELTNAWTLRNTSSTEEIYVPKIPSGVYTALKSTYGDILEGYNDVNLRWIANETWIYSTTFDDDELGDNNRVNLTLHGIDTVANVRLNGELLGQTNNMFVRYSYQVKLRSEKNELEIELLSPLQQARIRAQALEEKGTSAPPSCPHSSGNIECHVNMLRKMQMSFGGSWNPAAPSLGIWKTVAIEYYEVALLNNVDVAINRNNTHWTMDCRVFITTAEREKFYAEIVVYASELLDEPFIINHQEVNYAAPVIEFEVHIPKDRVKLWWPNGYGLQKLYPVLFSLTTYSSAKGPRLYERTNSQKLLKIGFRTIELVEDADNGGRTFFFRVNGHPIFMKGANYVPAHTLPELSAEQDTLEHLLKSAHDAHMNMIRVWGGGLYESDSFYNMADYYGLLVWQDMTFATATYPITDEFVTSVRIETAQNAKRLAYHPSLALIVTNHEIELYLVKNRTDFGADASRLENEYKILFMGTLKHELDIISRNNFKPRPGPMMSTPSLGIAEAGKDLPLDPQSVNYGDVHFWDDEKDAFKPDNYPRARFISEFGVASLPQLSSWQRTLGEESDQNLKALIQQRQHDPKGFTSMKNLFKNQFKNASDENIEDFIYFSQIAQAMTSKTAFDLFRSLRANNQTMGALMWQLNDVWVAPTWSCIDFYGNYKIVYYWARDFLAPTNVMVLYDEANKSINVTLSREDYSEHPDLQPYNLVISTYVWTNLFPIKYIARDIYLDSNEMTQLLNVSLKSVLDEQHTEAETFLKVHMKHKNSDFETHTYFYPVPIKDIQGIKDPNLKLEIFQPTCASPTYINSFSLRITIKAPALFVYLELDHPDYIKEKHQFSMNGFTQTEPVQTVHLLFDKKTSCLSISRQHIKFKTMNQYMIDKIPS